MQTGQNVHDPLTQLNSHLGYGLMAGLNPFADMGINPNDPNMVRLRPLFLNVTEVDECTAADDDELPRVLTTNVFFDVESSSSRTSPCT
jgi:hypothetical protein